MKYFKYSEFDSPDQPGSGELYMDQEFLNALDLIRDNYGYPMKVNSGYRSEAHNIAVKGVPNSQHRKGLAADIHINSQEEGNVIEALARKHMLGGVGRYRNFIHLDGRGYIAYWDLR